MNNRPKFRFLAFGNSITAHDVGSYWWGYWGMGASRRENDYVHQLASSLGEKFDVEFEIRSSFAWETTAHDRAEALSTLEKYHARAWNLVIVQVGENIRDASTLREDFVELIKYIRTNLSDEASIVIVGNFWRNDQIDAIKRAVCESEDCHFIDLKDIQDAKYCVGLSAEVFGDDGQKHVVAHGGVALHPNDAAMKICADRIFSAVSSTEVIT